MNMLIENQSKYNYEETENKIIEAIKKNNWNLICTLNFKQTLLRFGKEIKPAKIFEICKPEHAYEILKNDNERIISTLMPCRISIYEIAMRTNAHQPKMKLSLMKNKGRLSQRRIPCDLNLKIKK